MSSCIPASCNSLPAPLTVVGALMTIVSAGANRLDRTPPPAPLPALDVAAATVDRLESGLTEELGKKTFNGCDVPSWP